MKKAMFAMAMLMAIVLCGCGDGGGGPPPPPPFIVEDTNGKLTITGLETHNGKYVYGQSEEFVACADINVNTETITLGTITSGSVTLKVWKIEGNKLANYTKTETTTDFMIGIFSVPSVHDMDDLSTVNEYSGKASSVSFNSGTATISSLTEVEDFDWHFGFAEEGAPAVPIGPFPEGGGGGHGGGGGGEGGAPAVPIGP